MALGVVVPREPRNVTTLPTHPRGLDVGVLEGRWYGLMAGQDERMRRSWRRSLLIMGGIVGAIVGLAVLWKVWVHETGPLCNRVPDIGPIVYDIEEVMSGWPREEILFGLQRWGVPYREEGKRILVPQCGLHEAGYQIW